jgi:hypothetical protein
MSAFGGKADIAFEDQNNEIEELPCAAPNIKQLQFALIASSKGLMELRQCLASSGVGSSVQKHLDLGVDRSAEWSVIQPRD